MTVGYFCKHFSGAFFALMRVSIPLRRSSGCGRSPPVCQQCVCCVYLKVPASEMFLLCLEYVGDTTVAVVMECPRVRAALRERAAAQASQRGDRRPRLI